MTLPAVRFDQSPGEGGFPPRFVCGLLCSILLTKDSISCILRTFFSYPCDIYREKRPVELTVQKRVPSCWISGS
jgi:hypothetical protein